MNYNQLEDIKVNVKIKLAMLWASFMLLYVFIDFFSLYMPNNIANIIKGKVYVFDISQGFIITAVGLMTIPTLMIFLSVALPAKVNRWLNIIIAFTHIPYMLFNLVGEAWLHMYFAAFVEVVLLCLIISYAWQWPRTTTLKT